MATPSSCPRILLAVLLTVLPGAAVAQEQEWQPMGLLRVRDMTPFGISRLDMLPAYPVSRTPYTFAFEVTFSYQNTWALSQNVREYLKQRGIERGPIGPAEVAAIQALPGDAYMVDGELGLIDLTLHYRSTDRLAFYGTIPYLRAGGGFLDSTIENFHRNFGFDTADREFVPKDELHVVADLEDDSLVLQEPPDAELGDPVLGARYVLRSARHRSAVVLEGAVKFGVHSGDSVFSTSTNDYGIQLLLQHALTRNAFYLSLATVDYRAPPASVADDGWIPTVIGGWEWRIWRRTDFVVQTSVSKSTVQDTTLEELSAEKIQVTFGLQWLFASSSVRFGITENHAHRDNTPDVGVHLTVAKVFGRGATP